MEARFDLEHARLITRRGAKVRPVALRDIPHPALLAALLRDRVPVHTDLPWFVKPGPA